MPYHIAKGVFDILPKDPDTDGTWRQVHLWQHIENQARSIAAEFGFQEIRTPVFESTDLFKRSIGSTSDIVSKEMYTFDDKAGRSLTLRPEGTAPVMRSFIEKGLYNTSSIHKFYYLFSMFRYERQQAGRYRQHHQFGIEAIGSSSPYQDAEIIHLLWMFYERLGIKNVELNLNSIGGMDARSAFRTHLQKYLEPFQHELSPESKDRFHTNPLRILDSKNSHDQKILEKAPSILDFLEQDSKVHFESLCSLLTKIGIPFKINTKLVRGLDYYNKTVFEITSNVLGAQNSLGGGGRYDGLIKELGGPDLPAFGFGAGIERIIQTMLAQNAPFPAPFHPLLFLIPMGDEAQNLCFDLACQLRAKHVPVEIDFTGKKIKNAMRHAHSVGARFVAVIGENELLTKKLELKEMATGNVEEIPLTSLEMRLRHELSKNT